MIDHATGFKADIYIAFDALHRWALARRRSLDLDGMAISVAPPEYVIVRKLDYFREGQSEKHLRDMRAMLATSADLLDRAAIEDWAEKIALEREWKRALESI